MPNEQRNGKRSLLFISKATPQDDYFVLWLAPRLEAAGYEVFADIKSLQPGDRWRCEITSTLYNRYKDASLLLRRYAEQGRGAGGGWNRAGPG